jgi:hypothetical protein
LCTQCGASWWRSSGKKTVFWSHLYIKTIFLPRQARDKHRENSKKVRFSESGPSLAGWLGNFVSSLAHKPSSSFWSRF